MRGIPDGVNLFVSKLDNHGTVESCRQISSDDGRFVYLVTFSDNQGYEGSTRSGVDDLLSTLQSDLGDVGYDPKNVLDVYDSSTIPKNLKFGPIGNRQRLLVFDF